jgi:predicted phosphodiesterase
MSTAWPLWTRRLLVAVVAVLAAASALTAWGSSTHDIGPLETRLSLVPSWSGGVRVDVPPLGRLELPTHAGPLGVSATVTGIDPGRARSLLASDDPGRTVTAQVTADARRALMVTVMRAVGVALLSSALVCAVVFRRRKAVFLGTTAVVVVLAIAAGSATTTLRTRAFGEPTFDGLLVQAPTLIGRVQDFDAYSQRVAELTANVARVYGALETLPTPPSDESTRVLWVSDIHNNPQSFSVMRQLIEQFEVAAVLDTGDIVDVGSVVENRQLDRISGLGVPYLYVRGNHDSRTVTQTYIEAQEGAVVLDDGRSVEVAGVRFAGIGSPLFRPNRASEGATEDNEARLRAAGERLVEQFDAQPAPVDVALVHQSTMAGPLVGRVPLLLSGHAHERGHVAGGGSLQLVQGSSGGAGLRSLDGEDPMPLEMSVLHFDDEGALLAVDDITVGGLGQRSVTVERRTAASYGDVDDELPDAGLPREPQAGGPSPTAPAALGRSPREVWSAPRGRSIPAAGLRSHDVSVERRRERP